MRVRRSKRMKPGEALTAMALLYSPTDSKVIEPTSTPLLIYFEHLGEPCPASRPRVTMNGTFTPAKYRNYKKALAQALKLQYGHIAGLIPLPGSKERGKYLASHRYSLVVDVYRSANRGDSDNFLKAIQDALQDAGVIADDSQLDDVRCRKHIDRPNPRIAFTLEELKGD